MPRHCALLSRIKWFLFMFNNVMEGRIWCSRMSSLMCQQRSYTEEENFSVFHIVIEITTYYSRDILKDTIFAAPFQCIANIHNWSWLHFTEVYNLYLSHPEYRILVSDTTPRLTFLKYYWCWGYLWWGGWAGLVL